MVVRGRGAMWPVAGASCASCGVGARGRVRCVCRARRGGGGPGARRGASGRAHAAASVARGRVRAVVLDPRLAGRRLVRALPSAGRSFFADVCARGRVGMAALSMGAGASRPRVRVISCMETRLARRRRLSAGACVICMEPGPAARPSCCAHMFHLECLLHWSTVENTCPVCREVRPPALP